MADNKPDRDALEALHVQLTEAFERRLKEAELDPEKALSPAEMTALIKFLKDNNVTALLGSSKPGKNLLKGLPFPVAVDDE